MKRNNERKITTMEQLVAYYGKVPPQATDIEMAILGAFMLESDSYLMNPVNPEMFYKEEHKTICTVIQEMCREQKRIDLLTVTRRLNDKGMLDEIGGPLYITQLTSRIATVTHLPNHILILKDKYLRREMIRMSAELQTLAYEESNDLDEVIGSAQNIFMKLLSDEVENIRSFTEIANQVSDTMQHNATGKIITGICTGYKKFDDHTHGIQPGDLVIIAGESSHGKTMLATNMINYMAQSGYPCDIHSLEMTSRQLVSRIISIESAIPAKDMLYHRLQSEMIVHVNNHISKLDGLPIYFDDNSSASVQKICASIRKMVLKYSVKVAMVDYLQLISTDTKHGSKEEEIGTNARIFKNLAKELDIVVILLSQFSNSDSHVPNTGRLRGSGQIKEAADFVIMVWIPEKEGISTIKREDGTEESMKGKAGIIVGKGRNTGTIEFTVNCQKEINRMWDIESQYKQIDYIEPKDKDPF